MLAADPDAILAAANAYLLHDRTAGANAPLPDDLSRLPRFDPGVNGSDLTLRLLLLANRILTRTVVLARERLGPQDRFRPELEVMEDYDLWLRLARGHTLVSRMASRRLETTSRE